MSTVLSVRDIFKLKSLDDGSKSFSNSFFNNKEFEKRNEQKSSSTDIVLEGENTEEFVDPYKDDVEEWRLIEGYKYNWISSKGRVKRKKHGDKHKKSYLYRFRTSNPKIAPRVGLVEEGIDNKSCSVHDLVANQFLPPHNSKEKMVVEHLDGRKNYNNYKNLKWISFSEQCTNRDKTNDGKIIGPIIQINPRTGEQTQWESTQVAADSLNLRGYEIYAALKDGNMPRRCNWILAEGAKRLDNFLTKEKDSLPGEIWLPVVEYGFGHYEVSNFARILNTRTGRIRNIKNPSSKDQYICIVLKNSAIKGVKDTNFLLSRLVLKAHVPNPKNKPTVDHEDTNRHNNNLTNLRWADHKEQSKNKKKPEIKNKTNSRAVIKYKLDGTEDGRWDSITAASKATGFNINELITALKDQTVNKGFTWKYASEVDDPINYPNERWMPVPNPGFEPMEASDYGRVRKADKIAKIGSKDNGGYYQIDVYKVDENGKKIKVDVYKVEENGEKIKVGEKSVRRREYVHNFVMWAFKGRHNLTVNHKDVERNFDNSLKNLEYVTRSGNASHGFTQGWRNNGTFKATTVDVFDLNGKQLGVSPSQNSAAKATDVKRNNGAFKATTVGVFDLNGKQLGVYPSQNSAAKATGVERRRIGDLLKNGKSCNGYIFRKVENITDWSHLSYAVDPDEEVETTEKVVSTEEYESNDSAEL